MTERAPDRPVTERPPARLLFVVGGLSVGGIETYVLRVREYADPDQYHIDVCHELPETNGYGPDLRALGCRVFRVAGKRRVVGYVRSLVSEIRTHRYDAVCDFTGDFAAATMIAARVAGVRRRVAFYRSSGVSHGTDLARMSYRRAARAIVAATATHVLSNSRAALEAFHPRIVPGTGKWRVVYNGVDTERFAPVPARERADAKKRWGLSDRFVIGHVGGFKPVKNHAFLVAVLAGLRERVPNCALLLVGDGSERAAIEARIGRLGLREHVVLAGTQRDVAACLTAMDVFVFPSQFEGMSNALVEAQARGLPVIASDAPGVAEHIPSTGAELMLPVRTPDTWIHALTALANDPGRCARQGEQNRAHALAHYRRADRFDELLQLLAG